MSAQTITATSELPWGTTSDGELTRGGVLVGWVIGTIAVFSCLPLGIVGIVFNCMGLDRIKTDLPAAHKYLRASWIVFSVAPVLAVLGIVLLSI